MCLLLLLFLTFSARAEAGRNSGDWWIEWPEGTGVLIDDAEAVWLQSLKLGAYAHHQSSFVDGRSGATDFWYSRKSDWRRVRGVIKGRVADGITFSSHLNLVQDEGRSGGGVEFDYFSIFSADVAVDLAKWFEFDEIESMRIAYGKRKLVELSEEIDTSINSLLTVERSALAGMLVPFPKATAPTGGWVQMTRGNDLFSLGVFTTESSEEFGDWDQGRVYLASWRRDFSETWQMDEAELSLAFAWQDTDVGDELYSRWEWVFAPWFRMEQGRWGMRLGGAFGEMEDGIPGAGGGFHGLVVTPSCWVVEDRLLAVLRYQIMASEGLSGLRLPSRYAREAGLPGKEGIPALATGVGDFHESLYGGVVWKIVPKHFEMLLGLEWERLESGNTDVYEGFTGWFSTRVIF